MSQKRLLRVGDFVITLEVYIEHMGPSIRTREIIY